MLVILKQKACLPSVARYQNIYSWGNYCSCYNYFGSFCFVWLAIFWNGIEHTKPFERRRAGGWPHFSLHLDHLCQWAVYVAIEKVSTRSYKVSLQHLKTSIWIWSVFPAVKGSVHQSHILLASVSLVYGKLHCSQVCIIIVLFPNHPYDKCTVWEWD